MVSFKNSILNLFGKLKFPNIHKYFSGDNHDIAPYALKLSGKLTHKFCLTPIKCEEDGNWVVETGKRSYLQYPIFSFFVAYSFYTMHVFVNQANTHGLNLRTIVTALIWLDILLCISWTVGSVYFYADMAELLNYSSRIVPKGKRNLFCKLNILVAAGFVSSFYGSVGLPLVCAVGKMPVCLRPKFTSLGLMPENHLLQILCRLALFTVESTIFFTLIVCTFFNAVTFFYGLINLQETARELRLPKLPS